MFGMADYRVSDLTTAEGGFIHLSLDHSTTRPIYGWSDDNTPGDLKITSFFLSLPQKSELHCGEGQRFMKNEWMDGWGRAWFPWRAGLGYMLAD